MNVVLTPLASSDLDHALSFYSNESQAAAASFMQAFESCVALLKQFPNAGFELPEMIRQLMVSRFPYLIYYRIEDSNQIVIHAILHGRRDPKFIESRLKG